MKHTKRNLWTGGLVLLVSMAGLLAGCEAVGHMIWMLTPRQEKTVKAKYPGLSGHSVAVLFYVDEETQLEYPKARFTLGTKVAAALEKNIRDCRVLSPLKVARWQNAHLTWDTMDKAAIAKELKVDYLLFISLVEYSSHEPGAMNAYQGRISAEVQLYTGMIENKDDDPCVFETEDLIEAVHPKDARYSAQEEEIIRNETERQVADLIVKNFYDYKVPKINEEDEGTP